jgi:hypothetical protein
VLGQLVEADLLLFQVGAVLLGGFAALSGWSRWSGGARHPRQVQAGAVAEGNVAAAAEAYAYVERELEELAHAQAD